MDDQESEQLLRANLDENISSNEILVDLANRLEHQPLAMVQVAVYIGSNSIIVSRYLELVDKSGQEIVYLLSKEFQTVGRDSKDTSCNRTDLYSLIRSDLTTRPICWQTTLSHELPL
jgi:hypothetical protein